ncbi:MAG: chorismate mutase [Candidatus Methanomethylophilus sp.]|nr:chorismate mutase [Methanomethylophilus sp.]MCI2075286.1 chorismate mutase [Methanomethylophilus sp.]MCI2092628.1 chorismate mutase [Methanomethylophilus sp.]WII10041.1 chorismate mutase [Methanomassiliicoccales archaeon LGM-DZ1]
MATDIGRYKAENGMEVYDPSTARKVIDRYRYLGAENGMDPDRCEAICRAIMEESCANEERVSGARQDEAQDEQPEDTPDDNTAGRKAAMEYRNTGIILAAVLIIASAAVSFIGSDDAANAAIKFCLTLLPIALALSSFLLAWKDAPETRGSDELRSLRRRTWLFGGIFILFSVIMLALYAMY